MLIYLNYKNCSNIHFRGFVTHDILAQYYKNADVFVLPSLSEGFAQVSLEAMSCGLPVLCTKNSGCNDAVNNYETGIVIEPSNRKQLQDAISWFLLNLARCRFLLSIILSLFVMLFIVQVMVFMFW